MIGGALIQIGVKGVKRQPAGAAHAIVAYQRAHVVQGVAPGIVQTVLQPESAQAKAVNSDLQPVIGRPGLIPHGDQSGDVVDQPFLRAPQKPSAAQAIGVDGPVKILALGAHIGGGQQQPVGPVMLDGGVPGPGGGGCQILVQVADGTGRHRQGTRGKQGVGIFKQGRRQRNLGDTDDAEGRRIQVLVDKAGQTLVEAPNPGPKDEPASSGQIIGKPHSGGDVGLARRKEVVPVLAGGVGCA